MGLTSSQCTVAAGAHGRSRWRRSALVLAVRPRHRGLRGDAHRRGSHGPSRRPASMWTCSRSGSARCSCSSPCSRPASSSGRRARPGPGRPALARLRARRPSASLLASGRFSPASQLGVAMALDPGEGRDRGPCPVGARGSGRSASPGSWARRPSAPGSTSSSPSRARAAGTGRSRPTSPRRISRPSSTWRGWRTSGVLTLRAGGGRRRADVRLLDDGGEGGAVVHGRARAHARGPLGGRGRTEDGGQARPRPTATPSCWPTLPTDDGQREAVVVGEVLMPTFDDNLFNEGLVLAPDTLAAVEQTEGGDQVVVTFADGRRRRGRRRARARRAA